MNTATQANDTDARPFGAEYLENTAVPGVVGGWTLVCVYERSGPDMWDGTCDSDSPWSF